MIGMKLISDWLGHIHSGAIICESWLPSVETELISDARADGTRLVPALCIWMKTLTFIMTALFLSLVREAGFLLS
jgi:hypothetical protein